MFIPRHLGNICLGAVGMTILFWAGMYLEYVDKRNQLECYRDDDGNLELFIYWAYKVCLYVVTMITPPIVAIWCKRWCRQMRQEEGAQNLVEDVSVDSEP